MVREKIVVDEIPGTLILYSDGSVERPDMGFVPAGFDAEYEVQSKDIVLDPKTGLKARIYLPNTNAKGTAKRAPRRLPVVLFFHGGGWCLRSPSSPQHHHFCTCMAAKTSSIWISVDYRLAPEHKLPAAYHDCFAALSWLHSQSLLLLSQQQERENLPDLLTLTNTGFDPAISTLDDCLALHADFSRCFLLGDSAGGTNVYYVAARAASSWPTMWAPKMSRGTRHDKCSVQSPRLNVPVLEISRGPQHDKDVVIESLGPSTPMLKTYEGLQHAKDFVESPSSNLPVHLEVISRGPQHDKYFIIESLASPNMPMLETSKGLQNAKDFVESPCSNLPVVLEISRVGPQQAKYVAKSPGQIDLSMLAVSRGPQHARDFIQSPRRNILSDVESPRCNNTLPLLETSRGPQHGKDITKSPRGPQHARDFINQSPRCHVLSDVESPRRNNALPLVEMSRGPQHDKDFAKSPKGSQHNIDTIRSPSHTMPTPRISKGPRHNDGDFVESPRHEYCFSLSPMRILGIIMLHPAILPRRPTKGALMETNGRLTESRGDAFFRMAMPTGSQYGDPLVNPMSADATVKLSEVGLPPSLIAVAQGDLLHDNIMEFCEAIKNGKQKDIEVVVTPGEGHTFFLHKPHSAQTQNLEDRVLHFMKRLAFPARPPPSPRGKIM